MKPFYNTSTPNVSFVKPKELTSKELLMKLEDDYSNYRSDCNNGYCYMDQSVMLDFETKIKMAKSQIDLDKS